jgi:hypothetical protein
MKKYNIKHEKLIKMIRKNKIKNGTKIYCSDFVSPLYFENDNLFFLNCYDERQFLSFKGFIENIRYAKFKIEKYKLGGE